MTLVKLIRPRLAQWGHGMSDCGNGTRSPGADEPATIRTEALELLVVRV